MQAYLQADMAAEPEPEQFAYIWPRKTLKHASKQQCPAVPADGSGVTSRLQHRGHGLTMQPAACIHIQFTDITLKHCLYAAASARSAHE